jgi:hypothetical protein
VAEGRLDDELFIAGKANPVDGKDHSVVGKDPNRFVLGEALLRDVESAPRLVLDAALDGVGFQKGFVDALFSAEASSVLHFASKNGCSFFFFHNNEKIFDAATKASETTVSGFYE